MISISDCDVTGTHPTKTHWSFFCLMSTSDIIVIDKPVLII